MPDLYQGGRFGALKEIGYKEGELRYDLRFLQKKDGEYQKTAYEVPSGFVYPLLGSLRYLITNDPATGLYTWKTNPTKFYHAKVGKELIAKTFQASKDSGRNATAVGKKSNHWQSLFDYVARVYLESKP